MNHEEHEIQKTGVALCRAVFPICRTNLYAIPNGGHRSKAAAARIKAEGGLRGVWDLFLAVTDMYTGSLVGQKTDTIFTTGLYIEVKTPKRFRMKNNGLTKEQLEFRNNLSNYDYGFAICSTAQEIFDTVKEYLNG